MDKVTRLCFRGVQVTECHSEVSKNLLDEQKSHKTTKTDTLKESPRDYRNALQFAQMNSVFKCPCRYFGLASTYQSTHLNLQS